jgi:hypothetical protein
LHKQAWRLRIGTVIDPDFIRLGAFLRAVEVAPVEKELIKGMSGNVRDWCCAGMWTQVGFHTSLSGRRSLCTTLIHQRSLVDFAYRRPPGWEARWPTKTGTAQCSFLDRHRPSLGAPPVAAGEAAHENKDTDNFRHGSIHERLNTQ